VFGGFEISNLVLDSTNKTNFGFHLLESKLDLNFLKN